ncbi:MAG: hypothetical protein HYZ28_12875 [Myxococcales bacterium]|nr:hypothetical protein [Myxococcales bacterium]
MRWGFMPVIAVLGCVDLPPGSLPRPGTVEGNIRLTPGSRGDVFVFLYPQGKGLPAEAVAPRYVTAVSDLRLSAGDARFVFGNVQPNPYRLWAFLDIDRSFSADLDVLVQPGAGDRVAQGVELNLQPGERLEQDLSIGVPVPHEPPAFRLGGVPRGVVELPDQPVLPVSLELVTEPLGGLLSLSRLAFRVGLGDSNADGIADDSDGDGLVDLYPNVVLRFLPRPGQLVPTDRRGAQASVIVPLVFDPGPFLALLRGDASAEVAVDRLEVFLVPQAQAITEEPGLGRVVTPMDAIPVGEYELLVLHESGQYWRLPNALATEAAREAGGPFESQGVRFRFIHSNGVDGGQ